jgi:hypothetical protein
MIADESGESFIFSLTNNHKIILKDKKHAIEYFHNSGPRFGGKDGYNADLFIEK